MHLGFKRKCMNFDFMLEQERHHRNSIMHIHMHVLFTLFGKKQVSINVMYMCSICRHFKLQKSSERIFDFQFL